MKYWANLSLRKKGYVVVCIPLLAMLFAFVLSYLTNREQDAATEGVQRSMLVHSEADRLAERFFNAETGMRSYLLTHDMEFLEPIRLAKEALPTSINRLIELVDGSSVQTTQILHIQTVAKEQLSRMNTLVERAADPSNPAASKAQTDAPLLEERRTLDTLRGEIATLIAEEEKRLEQRRERLHQVERWRSVGDIGGIIIGLLGDLLAVQLFSNGIVRRVRGLRANADRLAEGVALVPQQASNDEIGELGAHFEKVGTLLRTRSTALDESLRRARRSESLYHALARNFPNGAVFLFDRQLRFLVADGRGLAAMGLSPETMEGRTVAEVYPEDKRAEMELLFQGTLYGTAMAREIPVADRRYHMQTLPIEDETGNISAGLVVMQDITERTRNEEALRLARDEAEKANAAKSEFLSRMSHELRTPLNAIIGFGQLLEHDTKDQLHHEYLAHILKGGSHLLGLINEVLDIARIESGNMQFSMEPVGIETLLYESLEMVRPLAVKRSIQLMVPPREELRDHFVQADQQRLRQIMLNLLSNAIKYNKEGGKVTLFCERGEKAGTLRVVVQDTGPGISPEKQHRLFIPFDRLDAEQSRVEGTGLGLALSQHLISAMGGTMSLHSRVGEGSAFWWELPVNQKPVFLDHDLSATDWLFDEPAVASSVTEPTRTLLYIEDNLSNVRLIESLIGQNRDIRLLTALQGTIGLELAREHRPDLILLDLHLPDLSGHDVLLRLRAEESLDQVPVIIMSADATPKQIARLTAAGANAYLTKPFQLREVLRVIDEMTLKS